MALLGLFVRYSQWSSNPPGPVPHARIDDTVGKAVVGRPGCQSAGEVSQGKPLHDLLVEVIVELLGAVRDGRGVSMFQLSLYGPGIGDEEVRPGLGDVHYLPALPRTPVEEAVELLLSVRLDDVLFVLDLRARRICPCRRH